MKRLLLLVAFLTLARTATAQIILETAQGASGSGYSVNAGQYLAARFHLDRLTALSHIGGHLGADGSLFFAILRVTAAHPMPVGLPFNDNEVVWSQTFTSPFPWLSFGVTADHLLPVTLTLEPGEYMIVAGSGRFGATGYGEMPLGTPIGTPHYLFSRDTLFPRYSWLPSDLNVRFLIHGQPVLDTAHQILADAVNTRSSQISVDQLVTTLGTKASQASVDGIAAGVGAVNMALAGRASQASVDGLTAAVADKASQVSVDNVASALAPKASQASLDALGSTVATQASVATLDTSIDGVAASVGALATQQQVADLGATLSNSIVARASQSSVDELHTKLDAQDIGTTRLGIERAIADGARVLSLMLPASAGGQLELVRQIVDEAIAGAQAAGLPITKASAEFSKGDAAMTAGDFRTAYLWYVSAYQHLLK